MLLVVSELPQSTVDRGNFPTRTETEESENSDETESREKTPDDV